jgi:hypothetical protein
MLLNDVSTILWRERQLLELLLFKLEEEQLVLASGRTRWLALATNEVETVLGEIRRTELARAVEVDRVAGSLGLGPNPSLSALAKAAPEPWRGILTDHRDAFVAVTEEILSVAGSNRELLAKGRRGLHEALAFLHGTDAGAPTYTPTGARAERSSPAVLVNEVL